MSEQHSDEKDAHAECGHPWVDHADDGVQMLCPDQPYQPSSVESGAARIVSRDLSPAAADLAQREGWAAHARMHPVTAAEYEARVLPPVDKQGETCEECETIGRNCPLHEAI